MSLFISLFFLLHIVESFLFNRTK